MALDSKSQMLMAQHGAIPPLVKLLQPGDPMVQASAAGALWNLAANEQNKFAIAQSGAIQPLVAMLYSEVCVCVCARAFYPGPDMKDPDSQPPPTC